MFGITEGEELRSQDSCRELLSLIERETRFHERLLALSRREQELLISGNLDELSSVIEELESVVANIADIVQARMQVMSEIIFPGGQIDGNAGSGQKNEDPGTCSDPCLSKCIKAMKDMEPLLEEIARINQANSVLVKNSLDYITFVKNMAGELAGAGTYTAPNGMVN